MKRTSAHIQTTLPISHANGTSGPATPRKRSRQSEAESGALFPTPSCSLKFKDPTDYGARLFLQEQGYVVFSAVANNQEIDYAKTLLWRFLEGLGTGIDQNNNQTWDNDRWPGSFSDGIISQYGIGQSSFLWHCRSLPRVKQAFATIWETDDLIVSFDGCGVFRPLSPSPKLLKWKSKGGWYHVDQNAKVKPNFECAQGLLNLISSGETDGGLVLVPKSHRFFSSITEKLAIKAKRDFIPIPSDEMMQVAIKRYGLRPIKLCLEPGDLALWDSRTIHCNTPPTSLENEIPTQLRRAVAYVCMTPKSKASSTVLEMRRSAVDRGITTSHWPHKYQPKAKPRWPRKGLFIPDDTRTHPSIFTDEELKLIG